MEVKSRGFEKFKVQIAEKLKRGTGPGSENETGAKEPRQ